MSDTVAALSLQAAFRTDPGRVRGNNEDLPLVDADRGIFGVIDGVGGQAAGELAAAIACDVILQRLARPLGTPAQRVREAIAIANNEIFSRAGSDPSLHGMTCVVTLALVGESTVTVGHVGDSRLYAIGPGGFVKITHDHSPVGEREEAGEISEAEAMRHPRRNEVFRDVGSAHRDKDEDDYVEVTEIPFDRTGALLLCTDGLTDMLTAVAIERLVSRFAGHPQSVVDALVEAANDAGGRDNVTVVYAEAADFARMWRAKQPFAPTSGDLREAPAETRPKGSLAGRAARAVVRSRTTWFGAGLLAGAFGTLGLLHQAPALMPAAIPAISRTLVVSTDASGAFTSIAAALQAARSGDTVQLEPGAYAERVDIPEGVSLVARVPGSATVTRAPDAAGEYVAMTAAGSIGGRIAGVRVESTTEAPVDVGIRVSGDGSAIEQMSFAGPMRAGVELLDGASASLYGNRFAVQGHALVIAPGSETRVTGNVFVHAGRGGVAPIALAPDARATVTQNVFAGFGADVVTGPSASEQQQIRSDNLITGRGEEPPAR